MKPEEPAQAIQSLVHATMIRCGVETVGAAIGLIAFTRILMITPVGSIRYFACLLLLVTIGFVAGVVWSNTLGRHLLQSHPASDRDFWLAAFRTQSKMLRWAPLWYCFPIGVGVLLFCFPTEPGMWGAIGIVAAGLIVVFGLIAWINLRVAHQLERTAALFVSVD